MTDIRVGAFLYDHTPSVARLAHVIEHTKTAGSTRYTLTDATHTQTRYCDELAYQGVITSYGASQPATTHAAGDD